MDSNTTAIVGWLAFTAFWNALKLPYSLGIAKYFGLPHSHELIDYHHAKWDGEKCHFEKGNPGKCPLRVSPIMRTKMYNKSKPGWITYHNVLAILMEIVFIRVYVKSTGFEDALMQLTILFGLQLPFFIFNYANNPIFNLPWKATMCNAVGVSIPIALLYAMWKGSTGYFHGLVFFWNLVPVLELVGTFLTPGGKEGRGGISPFAPHEDHHFEPHEEDHEDFFYESS